MYAFTRNFHDANQALGDSAAALGDTSSGAAAYFATRAGAAALFTKVLELKDAYQMQSVFPGKSQMWDFADSASAGSMLAWWSANGGTRQKLIDAVAYSDNSNSPVSKPGIFGLTFAAAPPRGFSAPTYQYFVNVIATDYPRLYSEAAAALGYNVTGDAGTKQYNASSGQIRTDRENADKNLANCTTGNPLVDIPCQIEKLGVVVKYVALGGAALGAAYVITRVVKAFRRP